MIFCRVKAIKIWETFLKFWNFSTKFEKRLGTPTQTNLEMKSWKIKIFQDFIRRFVYVVRVLNPFSNFLEKFENTFHTLIAFTRKKNPLRYWKVKLSENVHIFPKFFIRWNVDFFSTTIRSIWNAFLLILSVLFSKAPEWAHDARQKDWSYKKAKKKRFRVVVGRCLSDSKSQIN